MKTRPQPSLRRRWRSVDCTPDAPRRRPRPNDPPPRRRLAASPSGRGGGAQALVTAPGDAFRETPPIHHAAEAGALGRRPLRRVLHLHLRPPPRLGPRHLVVSGSPRHPPPGPGAPARFLTAPSALKWTAPGSEPRGLRRPSGGVRAKHASRRGPGRTEERLNPAQPFRRDSLGTPSPLAKLSLFLFLRSSFLEPKLTGVAETG